MTVAFGTPALQWLNKKNPEAGALGAPVRRLILTGRGTVGGRNRQVGPNEPALAGPPVDEVDGRHKSADFSAWHIGGLLETQPELLFLTD